jgi:protein SCO1/2
MKNKKTLFLIAFVVLFGLSVPFVQSLFFSGSSNGAIKIDKEVRADYVSSQKHFSLLFFGYVGCRYVCTPDLQKAAALYESKEFAPFKNDVELYFVNLTPEVLPEQPDIFAKSFNKDFKGVYLNKKEVMNIDRSFGVYFAQSLKEKSEIDHSDNLYLIENKGEKKILKQIYFMHPLNAQKLISDIQKYKQESR